MTVYFRFCSVLGPDKRKKTKNQTFHKRKVLGTIKLVFFLSSKQRSLKENGLQNLKQFKLFNTENEKYKSKTNRIFQKILKKLLILKYNQLLKLAIKKWQSAKFEKNAKKRFFGIIQRSTYSKVYQLFLMWKNSPEETEKKSTKLINSLRKIINKNIKSVNDSLMDRNEKGKNIKLLTLRLIFDKTVNQNATAFNKWANYTISQKLLEKTVKKMNLLQKISEVLRDSFSKNLIPLFNTKEKYFKQKILEKMSNEFHLLMKKRLSTWRNNSIKSELIKTSSRFMKNNAIKIILKNLNSNHENQLKRILYKFYENFKVKSILENLHNIMKKKPKLQMIFMDHTHSHKKEYLNRPNFLPSIRLMKAIYSPLLKNLEKMNAIFYSFKKQADEKKKKACDIILKKSIENLKNSLVHWNDIKNMIKKSNANQKILLFFTNVNEVFSRNFSILCKKTEKDKLFKKIIKKIIENNDAKKREALFLWKQYMKGGIRESFLKRKNILLMNSYFKKNIKRYKKMILKKFFQNSRKIGLLFQRIHKIFILKTKIPFLKIKNQKKSDDSKKFYKLEKSIGSLLKLRAANTFEPLKRKIQGGESRKEKVLMKGNQRNHDKFNKMFQKWQTESKYKTNLSKIKRISDFLYTLNEKTRLMLEPFYLSKENNRKKLALQKLVENLKVKKHMAFLHWKTLKNIHRILKKTNYNDKKTMAFGLMMNENVQKVSWIMMKTCFDKFKIFKIFGDNKKQKSLERIISNVRKTLSNSILLWRRNLDEEKNHVKAKKILRFYERIHQNITTNFSNLFAVAISTMKKKEVISKNISKIFFLQFYCMKKKILYKFWKNSLYKKGIQILKTQLKSGLSKRKSLGFFKIKGASLYNVDGKQKKAGKIFKTIQRIVSDNFKKTFDKFTSSMQEANFLKEFRTKILFKNLEKSKKMLF